MNAAIVVNADPKRFDAIVGHSLKEGGDLEFAVKPSATKSGSAGVVVTFTVELPNGKLARAQSVTTLRALVSALRVLEVHPACEKR